MLYNTQGIAAPTCLLSGDVFYMKYTTVSSDMCLVVMPYATLDFQFIEQHSMARFTCLHSWHRLLVVYIILTSCTYPYCLHVYVRAVCYQRRMQMFVILCVCVLHPCLNEPLTVGSRAILFTWHCTAHPWSRMVTVSTTFWWRRWLIFRMWLERHKPTIRCDVSQYV